jgi:hypothetical protein
MRARDVERGTERGVERDEETRARRAARRGCNRVRGSVVVVVEDVEELGDVDVVAIGGSAE